MRRLSMLGVWALLLGGCAPGDRSAAADSARDARASSEPLLVFAAADLRFALADIVQRYRAQGGDSVVLVFGSTGDLTTQIINGAPADLFFAANAQAIDSLAARTMIVDSTRRVYALGQLALVARCPDAHPAGMPCPAPARLDDLADASVRSISIADPAHAPYGLAARQVLERAGLWPRVASRIVFGANVSQAYQFVTTGNADVGIVALSLVARDSIRTYTLVDQTLHDPLRQTLAVLAASPRQNAADRFLQFLSTPDGQDALHGFGFTADPR